VKIRRLFERLRRFVVQNTTEVESKALLQRDPDKVVNRVRNWKLDLLVEARP
jgi:hypothetical protein